MFVVIAVLRRLFSGPEVPVRKPGFEQPPKGNNMPPQKPAGAPDGQIEEFIRRMLGGIFKRMYSLDQTRISRVFPQAMPLDLSLI